MSSTHTEPQLSLCLLDFAKPIESRLLLESIRSRVKIPAKVIFCDNGSDEDYPLEFLREGLVDQLLINRESLGLGIGTRDVINACQSDYFIYVQNDQLFATDFTEAHFDWIKERLENPSIKSVSLAGYPCGALQYSERAYAMKTSFYKSLEPLSFGGAGKFHEYQWREGQIQEIYRKNGYVHIAGPYVIQDNGVFATRDMGDAGVFCHRTDLKTLWIIVPPRERNPAYPKLTDGEFAAVLAGTWPENGAIPEMELKDSFDCWSGTALAQMQEDYIKDLRRRFREKARV